ncbi:MAG TPA: CAP domain-containing protein [Candidatus Dormibacteraeota bacterium]|nr:CAP domain-containing protein [Candidatus Dormibacteraeota bacterium]
MPAPAAPPQVLVGSGQMGLINQDRQAAGLAPLQWSPCLANVATGQAARMAAQGYISHANGRSLDLACHLGSRASESIGFQGGGINDAAMNAWFMGDPPHRANIMGPYHYVGVAWVTAANGTAYLAVEFT